jgi:hypothetical protein
MHVMVHAMVADLKPESPDVDREIFRGLGPRMGIGDPRSLAYAFDQKADPCLPLWDAYSIEQIVTACVEGPGWISAGVDSSKALQHANEKGVEVICLWVMVQAYWSGP